MNISKWFRDRKNKIFPNPSLQKGEISSRSSLPKGEITEKTEISSCSTLPKEMELDKRVSSSDIALAASQEFGVPVVDLDSIQLNHDFIKLIDKALIKKYQAIPIFKRANRLFVAVSDATNPVLKEIGFHTKMHTEAILVEEDKLAKVIQRDIDNFTAIKLYPNPILPKEEITNKISSRSPLPEKIDYNNDKIDEIPSLPSLPEERTELDEIPPNMKQEKNEPVAVELRSLEQCYQRHLMENGQQQIDIELVHARLADHYRDIELDFIAPKDFRALAEQLDEESQQRLALTVAGLDDEVLKEALPKCLKRDAAQQVRICFFAFAIDTDLLTIELLQQSPLRVEEFARQFLARVGAEIENETHAQSQQRLMRLDYRRLLNEAEQAKASAEERMDYLRQLREEQERRLARRGKW